ncbi:05373eac-9915-4f27-8ec9-800c0104091a [Sclerotinia trifoliorum]|uniref:05373eac-9915-4f27-8ec9-800c0104091a n=1 Tax=Sclerotinia trifoliorum TaxID=28548 RepID=A0A8H2VLT5_9HELO|nr:05373eac-9915-4f27-8ec9-800c0104091a [Sclerotinia trifoliorum]
MSVNADENDEARASLVDILPVEIIRAICEYLPVKDAANFRLTSNVCAAAGVDRLVQVIYLIFTRESFEKLLNISKHPEMSKHVVTIWYEPFVMETLDGNEFRSRDYGLESIYNKIREDQNLMKESKFSQWIFSQVLPKFRSLKRFVMENRIARPNRRLSHGLDPMAIIPQFGFFDRKCHEEVLAFLSAAGKADTKLEWLHIDRIDLNMLYRASNSTGIIFPDGPDARYLRYLHLGVWNLPSYHVLRQLLQATSNLEHLTIAKVSDFSFGYIDWDEVVPGLTLPRLGVLEFSYVEGSSTSLAKFLQRHSKSLKSFKIRQCSLKSDPKDWAEVFDTIRNDLTLQKVNFMGIRLQEPNIAAGFEHGINFIILTHIYHGHRFKSLLNDRLLHKDLLAKECSLIPSVLWYDYRDFGRTESQKAKARLEELESQGLSWDVKSEEDMRLRQFWQFLNHW